MKIKPKVAVLMATYNGLPWLPEQVKSILNQSDVDVQLTVSDDCSNDDSMVWLNSLAQLDSRVVLLPKIDRFSSAGKNFYRLIYDTNIDDCDYVAFADQDDIWESDKLISHIEVLKKHQADGVSSNVLAFWPDGKKKLIIKSQPQRKWDFLFESAGPGCTFLMTPWLVNKVREQLVDEHSPANKVALHDWLTYAVCRANGHKWVIDSIPSVQYRQHQSNVVGANVGLKAKWARLQKLRQGWYRKEVIKVAQICIGIAPNNETNKLVGLLKSKNLFSQLKLLAYVSKARRSLIDRFMLALSIAIGLF